MSKLAVSLGLFLSPFVSSEVETHRADGSTATRLSTSLETNGEVGNPEARPFSNPDTAPLDVTAAQVRAKATGHRIILVFGANWCHDSRALAGWFATPRFAAMLEPRYEIVWVDVGNKDRNLDLARRYGLHGIKGTPTVLVVDRDGKSLNRKDAPGWRNASTRSADAIYDYFAAGPVTSG